MIEHCVILYTFVKIKLLQMSFQDRINQIMDHYKLSAKDLAGITGVQRSAISHLINGRNKPSVAFITQLTAHFTDLNVQWLLHGNGELVTNVINKESCEDILDHTSTGCIDKRNDNSDDTNVTSATNPALNLQMLTQPSEDSIEQNTIHKKHVTKIICVYSDGSTTEFNT